MTEADGASTNHKVGSTMSEKYTVELNEKDNVEIVDEEENEAITVWQDEVSDLIGLLEAALKEMKDEFV